MNREDLTNHIKGSYLKKQYLESFLVQSAYIEGLLKLLADYSFWEENQDKLKEGSRMINTLRRRLNDWTLNELIKFLRDCELIDEEQKKSLIKYKDKRNSVLHDLVSKLQNQDLVDEIKSACDLGNDIISKENFKNMEKMIDDLEVLKKAQEQEVSVPEKEIKKDKDLLPLVK